MNGHSLLIRWRPWVERSPAEQSAWQQLICEVFAPDLLSRPAWEDADLQALMQALAKDFKKQHQRRERGWR